MRANASGRTDDQRGAARLLGVGLSRATSICVLSIALMLTGSQVMMARSPIVSPPADVPDGMEWDPHTGLRSDVLTSDAENISRRTGADVAVVQARLVAETEMEDLIGAVRRYYPTFVGVYWTSSGVTAQFTGNAPAGAVALLAAAGAPVSTEVVRYTEDELESLRSLVSIILGQAGCVETITAVDSRRQRIDATVAPCVGSDIDAIRAEVARSLPDVEVSIDETDLPLVVEY
jgi:hypothetical protein